MADDPPLEQVVAKTFEAGARGRFASFLNSNTSWNISGYSATNHDDIYSFTLKQIRLQVILIMLKKQQEKVSM